MRNKSRQLEAVLRQNNAEGFIEAVAAAMQRPDRVLMTSLLGFRDEPDLLYAALLYASVHRVTVLVMPAGESVKASDHSY